MKEKEHKKGEIPKACFSRKEVIKHFIQYSKKKDRKKNGKKKVTYTTM